MARQAPQPSAYRPPRSAQELFARYTNGERFFAGSELIRAVLTGANLSYTSFFEAHLTGADLAGAVLLAADLTRADLYRANLHGADLNGAILTGAVLLAADLVTANLTGASLTGADLRGANLRGANLTRADLTRADLTRADLTDANLTRADLTGAKLTRANLTSANLSDARFDGAIFQYCVLSSIDVSPLSSADPPLVHTGPSFVDFDTVIQSVRLPASRLEDFLTRAGVPSIASIYMIEAAQAASGSVFDMMRSTFISYGSPDEKFAKRLYEALHKNGVRVFLFSEHAEPGEKLHRMMRKGVNEHDRVVLVCSKNSLVRSGVLNEIELTLGREAREGGETLLIPIRLDNYVFTGWQPPREDLAEAVRERVVADFEGADTDPAKFDAALSNLLRALRIKGGPPTTSGGAGP
ncbi:toll/interleukin-1 receptor domain-containing protein [Polyangium jinanense]|uniref:Toll/interleukin-1 receptor domain-containing protein n=1 Tax=Polyangium jinanense TaxID=2829994 RepID=A0A9X3XF15_9BACT|nr:toll/interleukin-1 receptor domain-containing protein [Polyangium jinanense]MDC3989117.1 toll/interleukin-1 receptor domain-containing protein [Polyangium jinanense]